MGTVIDNICIREFQIVEIHVLGLLKEGTRMPCGLMQLNENPWRYPADDFLCSRPLYTWSSNAGTQC